MAKKPKKQIEPNISVDIDISEEVAEKKITKQQFYKALNKVIESEKKQDSKDS